MKFEYIEIENFRNFEKIHVKLDNKNVFFGMNDVGKTNFLYALRFIFDRDVRKNGFLDSDYYKKNTNKEIRIKVNINISDNDDDSQKIRAKIRGNIISDVYNIIIELVANYDSNELIGNPILYWGYDEKHLKEIPNRGTYSELDYLFKVIYIDAYVDVYSLFKKNTKKLISNNNDESDVEILNKINEDNENLNSHISSLSGIQQFENAITPNFKKMHNEEISIKIKSEIAIRGLYANIVPYIKNDNDGQLYPTSGEGRKKLLAYSIYNILSEENNERYINLFLIEEPENHLHVSLQKALSNILFVDSQYKYLFLTTHSSNILSDMDDVNLIRIFNSNKIDSKSILFSVPKEFKTSRKTFNDKLSRAIFFDKVLLVEGPSEEILFERILSSKNYFYEANGIYILPVYGIRFKPYYDILKSLGIQCFIRTDNDLRKNESNYSVLGFSRINNLIGERILSEDGITGNSIEDKRKLYDDNIDILNEIRKNYNIYLSRCSLEEDLDEVIHDKMIAYLPECGGNPIYYLQLSKQFNMAELVKKLKQEDCDEIFEHYNFECLKEVLK